MKILIVDDSITMIRLIMRSLKSVGYTDVIPAISGELALQILNDEKKYGKIDLILLDWHMPKMSGLEVLKRIKNGPHKDIPVFMLTQELIKENVITAIKNGASDYIIKPLNAQKLIDKIHHLGIS